MNQFAWCDETINGKYTKINDVYYATTAYLNDEYKIFRGIGDWSDWSSQPLTINTEYPISTVSFNSWLEESASKEHKVTLTIGTKTISTTPTNSNKVFNSLTNEDISIRTIKFDASRHSSGNKRIYIGDIYVYMAPHIIMSTNSLEFDFNKDGTTDTTKKDVIFHSFLTANNLTYQVINKKDDNPNPYFTLHETKTVGNNTFSAIGDTQYNFKVTFNPVAEKHDLYEARIKITDGVSTAYVNLSGYKHNQTISWEQNLTEMILYEDIELTAIASPDPQMPITYTWSPEDAFLCEGNRIVPIKVYDNAYIS